MQEKTIRHFEIVRPLGQGGMGEVYLATDVRLNRPVALKFLAKKFLGDAGFGARFIREAQAAAKLSHPNIVTIFEVDEDNGRPYFAMRYLSGGSLRDLIRANTLSTPQRLALALEIAEGLQVAHTAGIVHRDLKPTNIMLDENGRPVILDFGLAKLQSAASVTSGSMRLGTLAYMSPEQALGEPLDARSDIFSFGSVMYELFTGEAPFHGEYDPAVVYSIIHETPPPLALSCPDAPPGLQQTIDRALCKDRMGRYQRVSQVIADLRLAQLGREPEAAPAVSQRVPIAVLHLRNRSEADDEYLAYGLTEELIVALTKHRDLKVSPLRAVAPFKNSDESLSSIAEKLGVRALLEGSIQRIDNRAVVTLSLFDGVTQSNGWANRWDEPLTALQQIRDAALREIVSALRLEGAQSSQPSSDITAANNPHAYEMYLRGRFAFDKKRDESDVAVASGFFRRATEEEPNFLAAYCGMAETFLHQGRLEEAQEVLTQALAEARRLSAQSALPQILRLLAQRSERQSRWDEALDFATQAHEISVEISDLTEEAESLAVLIQIYLRRADLDAALALHERTLEIAHMLGDKHRVAEALRKMGNVHLRRGDIDEAVELYQQSLRIGRQQRDLALQAHCLSNLGQALYQKGDYQRATELATEALGLRERLGDHTGQAATLNIIAMIHYSQGGYRDARVNFSAAEKLYAEVGDEGDVSLSRNNAGYLRAILGDYDRAISDLESAREIAERINYPLIRVSATRFLGLIQLYKGEVSAALTQLTEALRLGQQVGLQLENAITLAALAEAELFAGNFASALEHATDAYTAAQETSERAAEYKALAYRGAALCSLGQSNEGLPKLRAAVDAALDYKDPQVYILAQRLLGRALAYAGADEKALSESRRLLTAARDSARETGLQYELDWLAEQS
ncbi:MAG TPA: tetratricopeptide repeat protein [candidate division Zixibacteria bacterium]|nr:tetratricopeptide repeat protein [candidate division Zixibacteria bacterium]